MQLRLVSDHYNGTDSELLALYQSSAKNYTASDIPDATKAFVYA